MPKVCTRLLGGRIKKQWKHKTSQIDPEKMMWWRRIVRGSSNCATHRGTSTRNVRVV